MYLLDSNVFIEAANRYYAHDICPGFRDWLDAVCPARQVFSIRPVHEELSKKGDTLAEWIETRRSDDRFLPVDDGKTQRHFGTIAEAVVNSIASPKRRPGSFPERTPGWWPRPWPSRQALSS